jgi:protocatechuate 3,4-dioxygenase beta subunit
MTILWAVGFLAAALPALAAGVGNEWQRRQSRLVVDPGWLKLLDELSRQFAIRRRVDLRTSPSPRIPVTWGVARPVILLPEEALRWPEPARRLVLLHELAHIARRDVAYQLVGRLAASLHWFHPLAWYALHRLRTEGECACDDAVVHLGARRTEYAQQLVDLARSLGPAGSATAVAMTRKNRLERRILALFDERRSHRPLGRRPALGLLAGAIIVLAGLAGLRPGPSIAGSQPDTTPPAVITAPVTPPLATGMPLAPVREVSKGRRAVDTGKTVVLRGKVVGPDGRPVAGARFFLSADPWTNPVELGTSGGDGAYRVSAAEKAFYRYEDGVPSALIRASLIATAEGLGAGWADIPAVDRDPGSVMMKPEYVRDFHLDADLPIAGRVVDAGGKPVAGAVIDVVQIHVPAGPRSWEPVLASIKAGDPGPLNGLHNDSANWRIPPNRTAWKSIPPGITDAEGRFRVSGIGRHRAISLSVSGPGIRTAYAHVLTRDDVDDITRAIRAKYTRTRQPDGKFYPPRPSAPPENDGVQFFGPSPTIEVDPARTVAGTVRDAESGEPIPGAYMVAGMMSTSTDGQGRFHILRGEDEPSVWVYAQSRDSGRYLSAVRRYDNAKGLGEIVADFNLPRGVVIEGQVVESGTGRPIVSAPNHTCHVQGPGIPKAGYVHYFPLSTNAVLRGTPAGMYFEGPPTGLTIYTSAMIGEGGRFRIAVPPGPGVLLVQADPGLPMFGESMTWKESEGFHRLFPYATLAGRSEGDGVPGGDRLSLPGFSAPIAVNNYHAYRVIDPPVDAKSLELTMTVPRAPSRMVRFVGPDGRAIRGVRVRGLLAPPRTMTVVLDGSEAEVLALDPASPRQMTAISNDGKYAATVTVAADDPQPRMIRLEPMGSVPDQGRP